MTTEEKVKEIKRELDMRKRVFPAWVLQGRISQAISDKRIKVMEEILADYQEKLKQENKQKDLFEEEK